MEPMKLYVDGVVKSGKNHMQITRTGHKYPLPAWAAWRDGVVLRWRCLFKCKTITKPVTLVVEYRPPDRRKRDVAGMLDALCHCLERADIVADDALIVEVHWLPDPKRAIAGATLELIEREA